MTITTCPKCGSMNITTAGVCANCGWSQFAQVTTVSTRITGEIEIKVSGKALLDDYKRLLLENRNLKERVAELEAKKDILENQLREATNFLIDKKLHVDSLYEEGYKLQQRIAELEEQVWNLNLENERLEEAYWIDETISPDGTLKPSVRKLLERLEKAETDLRLSDDLVKALDNRIAKLEAVQRWIPVSERLPKDLQSVVIITNDSMTGIVRYLELYGREGFGSWSEDVTHWMPLPELPEGRER